MKVTIVGGGNVGSFLAQDLVACGHQVLLIEQDEVCADRLRDTIGCQVVVGDGCELSTLSEAKLEEAEVIVAATGDDEDNLVISLLAKQEFTVPRVIARVNHPKNYWLFNRSWGVDVSVSTPHLISSLVEEAVSIGSLVKLLQFERSGAKLVEVTLAPDSPAINASIAELGLPKDASIVAIIRGQTIVVPRGEVILKPEDEVIALVIGEAESDLMTRLIGL
jgi:trk system potassium uptake protein TrkA